MLNLLCKSKIILVFIFILIHLYVIFYNFYNKIIHLSAKYNFFTLIFNNCIFDY